ncbi:MAG: UDP-N-acetylmuramoyl-tripeptide--D-alanyl-D-alanine ligase [Alphaproteobacteria bacterium]|nr:UDP-N-acetylmuramoyl-tripeptide--D-alanyl-D-alanine ligase [Alphaproteobacteria bacterium]
MTALWTAKDAAAATGGTAQGNWTVTGVSIDSRTVEPEDLFIAIRGPNTDGHLHVKDALVKGAAAAMVARDWADGAADDGMPLLIVADTDEGLNRLARAARDRGKARVVAITGSVGKTSTKEALAQVLSQQAPTTATVGNLNNQWGLPLSMARMPAESIYGVFELGMNHAGELTPLSKLLRPNVAIVTTVESVHLEFFESEEAIADAKGEIFAGMGADGAAVLNAENRHFERLKRLAKEVGIGRVFSFGATPGADFHLIDWRIEDGGNHVEADLAGRRIRFRTGGAGRHWAMIGVSVLGVAWLLGADLDKAAAALADTFPPKGRGLRHRVRLPDGGIFTVIDESYNASPASMRASIAVLGATPVGAGARRIAVLGDMLELGKDSAILHAGLAPDLADAGVNMLFACGPDMSGLVAAVPPGIDTLHAGTSDGLIGPLTEAVRDGDVVTVKGSLGSRMAPVVEALLALGADPRGQACAAGKRG